MRNRIALFISVFSLCAASQARAIDNFDLSTLTGVTDDSVSAMIRPVALGADHRAYMPASSMGVLGFDFGVDVTMISLPSDFVTAFALATNSAESAVPGVIPVPKLGFHKGLPGGVDFGFSYASSSLLGGAEDLFSFWGLDLKYTFLSGVGPLPAVAARFSMSSGNLWFLDTKTYALDAIVSKNLYIINPYVGAGLKYWTGDMQIPASFAGQTFTFSTSQSSMNPHIFAGIPLKLLFLRLTAEVDYNLAGITTYGGKLSFGF